MADEFVSPASFVKSARGRKTEWNETLIATLAKVSDKQGVVLRDTIGTVDKDDRAAVSASIRKHWRRDRTDEPSISFSNEGIPQVEVKKAKRTR